MRADTTGRKVVLALVALALAVGYGWDRLSGPVPGTAPVPAAGEASAGDGAAALAEAYRERRSDLWVEAEGTVRRTLPDDREGSGHQRFIVELAGGQTVLVSHNIDLAPRLPVEPGDPVRFRGEYEWNDLGGVVHWTHHDPDGRHLGGWLRHEGRTYR